MGCNSRNHSLSRKKSIFIFAIYVLVDASLYVFGRRWPGDGSGAVPSVSVDRRRQPSVASRQSPVASRQSPAANANRRRHRRRPLSPLSPDMILSSYILIGD